MNLYLALDVGGTKTAASLADERRTLVRASTGSIKVLRVAPEAAAANLARLLAELTRQAGTPIRGRVARTCVGSSGMSAPAVRAWLHAALNEAVGGELILLGDEVIALDAAFHGGRGVLAIAGTGSNIVGRAAAGELMHTGGWGPALADEGSGHWIGAHALRAGFRALDAAPPSSADRVSPDGTALPVNPDGVPPLLQAAMAALGAPTLDDLIGLANAPGFASSTLVPVVVAAARAGDPLAAAVLAQAGRDLAASVSAVIRKMRSFESGQLSPPEVAYTGSVLTHVAEVREAMHADLRAAHPGISLQAAPVDPLEGALWHARSRL